MNDKEIIDRITMVCQSDASVKLGYDDTAWTDKEKLVQIMRILGKTTQTDNEKLKESLELIDKLLWNISDSKERWINTSVNHEAFNSFLDAVISNLEKMKKTLS